MAKLTLDTIAKYDEISKINNNFDKIEAELQNKVLYRNNPIGEPNTIEGDVDFNNKNVFNVNEVRASDLLIDGVNITASVVASQTAAAASATAAASSASSASSSASAAATSASQAAAAADFIPEIANYAALRAYSGPITEFHLKGHTSVLDGGAGVFRVDTTDTTSADNGGTILVDASGRRWKREFSGAVNVRWFGAKGDGVTDDAMSMDAAVAYAALTTREVFMPAGTFVRSTSLNIPAGVVVRGEGRGSTVIGAGPTTGSIIKYTGSGDAIKLNGALSGLEFLSVVGTVAALGAGVLVNGDGNAVESWRLRSITIYEFTGGTGLKLLGINSGAVAYGLAVDVRIRNAKTGLWIVDAGGGAGFCNTNQFYGGAINGGGFDYGIRVQGGNDNRFLGMSVEPPSSTVGHIVVERGWINFDGRLEGSAQSATVPVIDIQAGTDSDNCIIAGLGGSGLVKNAAGASIKMINGKHAEPALQNRNIFPNPAFSLVDATERTIDGWTVTETGGASTWAVSAAEVVPGHAVIQIAVAAGRSVELKPAIGKLPPRPSTTAPATFGMWVKTETAQTGYARVNGIGGVTSSAMHSGSGAWEAISMSQNVATGATPDPRFVLDGGASGVTYYITAPYFVFGFVQPHEQRLIGQEGGHLYGTLEGGACTITLPAAGDSEYYTAATAELTAPRWGNTIHIAGTARTITRLNNVTANRMAKGTVLRLVFDIGGVGVTDGNPGYIDLTAAFTSANPATESGRSWLLLESKGDGTWYELQRR